MHRNCFQIQYGYNKGEWGKLLMLALPKWGLSQMSVAYCKRLTVTNHIKNFNFSLNRTLSKDTVQVHF